jgi:hypothetical protein
MIAPGVGTAIGGAIGGLAGLLGPMLYNYFTTEHSPSPIDKIAAARLGMGKVPGTSVSTSKSVMVNQTNNFTIEATQRLRPEEFAPFMNQVGRDMAMRQLLG